MKDEDSRRRDWTIIGPGGGGATYLPTINPRDPGNVIAVCDMTGAYVTWDAGESWREFNLKARVDAIAFDPSDANTVYAGSSGLYRSQDKGKTWQLVFPDPLMVTGESLVGDEAGHVYLSSDNWPGGEIHGIAIDPDCSDSIHICVQRRYGDNSLATYGSFDGGKSWTQTSVLFGTFLHRLYFDPSAPVSIRRVIAFTNKAICKVNMHVTDETPSLTCENAPCSADSRVPQHTCGLGAYGAEAEAVSLPYGVETVANAGCGRNRETGEPVFFILSQSRWEGKTFRSGIHRSADFGKSWTELAGGLDDDLHGPDNGQGRQFRNIAAVDADAGTVWVDVWRTPMEFFDNPRPEMNYCGIMKSSDGGDTWKWSLKIGATYPENLEGGWLERSYNTDWYGGPLGMGAGPANPDVCWLAGYMGIYRTQDGGLTWRQMNSLEHPDSSSTTRGMDVTTCYGMHFDPFDNRHLAISYTDIGLHHSRDGGKSWRHSLSGVPRDWINTCYWLVFDPEVKERVWSVWAYSHDLPRFKMFRNCYFETSPGGICRSDDGMETWRADTEGMPAHCSPVHIVLDPASPAGKRTLYAAVMGGGVCRSRDDGRSWLPMNRGLSANLNAWRLALLPDGTLYLLLFSGYRDGRTIDGQIFKSCDGAENWREISMPEGSNAPCDLQFDPSNPLRMYLACWPRSGVDAGPRGGLFRTEDGGESWKRVQPADSYAYAVAVHPDKPSTVFYASFDGSVRRSDDRGDTWRRLAGYDFKWGHRPIVDPVDGEMLYVTTFGSSVWHGPASGAGDP